MKCANTAANAAKANAMKGLPVMKGAEEIKPAEKIKPAKEIKPEKEIKPAKGIKPAEEKMTYKDAGVDIDAGNQAVQLMKKHVRSTFNKNVLTDIGSFGGLFAFEKDKYKSPVLVGSTDGVGTKLKIAYAVGQHDTVGQDLVNHCVNDILVMGAEPLFFLDYIGTGKLRPSTAEGIVKGLSKACAENGCALIGGETAEMPGIYNGEEYDLAGTIVGVVEKDKIIDGSKISEGDAIIGLVSTGLHTNGYSLAIKVLHDKAGIGWKDKVPELGCMLYEAMLKVHKSYLKPVKEIMKSYKIKGMAHLTGGGFYDNIPRVLPENMTARISKGSWPVLPIFKLIQKHGSIDDREMHRTFNMGIGLVIVADQKDANSIIALLKKTGQDAYLIGKIAKGRKEVIIE
jgi:phosphoribosylformylglycinamidine cyclo-ligase